MFNRFAQVGRLESVSKVVTCYNLTIEFRFEKKNFINIIVEREKGMIMMSRVIPGPAIANFHQVNTQPKAGC